jgi:hypothetical protein
MRQLIPTPYSVAHIPRSLNKKGPKDSHGNYQMVPGPPTIRKVQSITQFGRRGSSRALFTTERTGEAEEVTLHIAVPNPEVYANGDQVLIDPQIDPNGNYVAGTGVAYYVDGDPSDERRGPWPQYLQQFGGIVKLRRVS